VNKPKHYIVIIFTLLVFGVALSFFEPKNIVVQANSFCTVSFDYNQQDLTNQMPLNEPMRSSIENYSFNATPNSRLNVNMLRTPNRMFNSYYTYRWTLNNQYVDLNNFIITEDVTFEMEWTPVEYMVKFVFEDNIDKTQITNLQEKIYFTVESPRIELYKPVLANYDFVGWYNGTVHYDMLYIPAGSIGSKELKARFVPTQYTINYNTKQSNNNPRFYNVTDSNIKLSALSKEGHIFKGWFLDENYLNQVTEIDCSQGGNINLYPLWEKEVYTVTYILPNGNQEKIAVEYGDKADLIDVDKNFFEIIITSSSRNNITEDKIINVKVVNIWYVYALVVVLLITLVVAIVLIKRKRAQVHITMRKKYQNINRNR